MKYSEPTSGEEPSAGERIIARRSRGTMATERSKRIIVIGGGISGLAAAHRLVEIAAREGINLELVLLEASTRLGGVIRTFRQDDFIFECGPDSFITQKPWAVNLCQRLELAEQIVQTSEKCRRTYVAFGGKLHPLPEGFMMLAPTRWMPFLRSSLFTWGGKLRMAADLLLPAKPIIQDESLADFVVRRLGRQALERIAQPMVGGIYTADPAQLSMKASMPIFLELEKTYGSVIRGMWHQERQRRRSTPGVQSTGGQGESGARYSLFVTLKDGLDVLVDTLAERLPEGSIAYDSAVARIARAHNGINWTVTLDNGQSITGDAVIVCTPAYKTATMVAEVDPDLRALLASISFASSAVLTLIYNRTDISHPLDGFGFVVPAVEGCSIIACTFSNIKFPGRAPDSKVILRVFLGGALQPHIFALSDDEIEGVVQQDLKTYLGVQALPQLSLLSRHPLSMPQFHVGHLNLVAQIQDKVSRLPGLALAGNSYLGVGIPDCIHSGELAAESMLAYLTHNTK
ncbi:MAG: protoporphyrinogen oxidase [Candidatus Melainabacteria bacterium]|nr:protoporphyrinogen oxidase [Candidatus Melainabacteria bacterium]